MNMNLRRTAIVFAVMVCFSFSFAQDSFDADQKRLLLASFEEVWTTVKDRHYDPELGGLDWQAVYERYRPRIESSSSMDEGRNIMNEMLGLLKQTHIGVMPANFFRDMQGGGNGNIPGIYTPGIVVRVLDGKAVVTRVETAFPADAAGVKPGWEILKIGGREVAQIITRLEQNYSDSTLKCIRGASIIEGLLLGPPSTTVDVEFHDGGAVKELRLERAEPKGARVTLGEMPASHFWVETDSIKDGIKIIRFNLWFDPEAVTAAFSKIMAYSDNAKGFIIDLRGNGGGIAGMAMGAAGWFTSERGLRLGTTIMRGTTLNFAVFPRANATNAPLAILIDGCSASTSEIFAGGMQDMKRARIFGTRSAGAALPSNIVRLPNGDGFQYIVANYISEGGKQLEGFGVIPDEIVELTQRELLTGIDPVLNSAVAWIQSH